MASSQSLHVRPSTAACRGLWLLPLAGILIAVITLFWIVPPPGASDTSAPADMARMMSSAAYIIFFGWFYFAALVVLILGLQALYSALTAGSGGVWAPLGLALGTASAAALLAAFGAAALGGAIVADSYLQGNTGTADAMQHLSGGNFGAPILYAFLVADILALASAVTTGIALWRMRAPRWAVIVFGVSLVLIAVSVPLATTLGGLLLLASGVTFARMARQTSVTSAAGAGAPQPA